MIDLVEIDKTIEDIESGNLTLGNCADLANLYIIREYSNKQGLIQDTDEDIVDIQSLIVRYMIDRDIISLNILLHRMREVLSELYHTCDTPEERKEFTEFVNSLPDILTPTEL